VPQHLYDLKRSGELLCLIPLALVSPYAWFSRIAGNAARFFGALGFGNNNHLAERIAKLTAGSITPNAANGAARRMELERYRDYLHLLRFYRPDRFAPPIAIEGWTHVEEAERRGHGAIVLADNFIHHNLILSVAFARAGRTLAVASTPTHGFSSSRFGMRVLNPIRLRIEDRIARRVVLDTDRQIAWMRDLRRTLLGNNAVRFTAGDWVGRQCLETRFLNGCMRLATGGFNLALSTNAALIPQTTIWDDRIRTFRVIFEEPIRPPAVGDRKTMIRAMMQSYLERLEPRVLADPGQWRGWYRMLPK